MTAPDPMDVAGIRERHQAPLREMAGMYRDLSSCLALIASLTAERDVARRMNYPVSAPQTDFGSITMKRANELLREAVFGRYLLTDSTEAEAVVLERLRSYGGPPGYCMIPNLGCDFTGEIRNVIQAISERAANAEAEVAELTASLGTVEKERDELIRSLEALTAQHRMTSELIAAVENWTIVERDQALADLAAARETLKPFAAIHLIRDTEPERAEDMIDGPDLSITPRDVRQARRALRGKEP